MIRFSLRALSALLLLFLAAGLNVPAQKGSPGEKGRAAELLSRAPSIIRNPILPGFNPDPDILRVGDDYYIATTTFEWFPGVRVYHSKDLVHWRLLTHVLTRRSQLDLAGVPDSGGIFIPSLSYRRGTFYVVFSVVKGNDWPNMAISNYYVTARAMEGPWSEPVYLNSSGFDPAFFFDDDGKAYLVQMILDYRDRQNHMAGITLQEFALAERRPRGLPRLIFKGSETGWPEGPHLYKRGGYYYLMCAEGGTSWNHVTTVARSRSIGGPYEVDPQNPVLTSRDRPLITLQKAGQGGLVETQTGEWYLVHHAARPLPARAGATSRKAWTRNGLVELPGGANCPLGRETCLQRMAWTADGWIRLAGGGHEPLDEVPAPNLRPHPFPAEAARDDFNAPQLDPHFNTLREPADRSWLSLTRRPGYLRLRGRQPLTSLFEQSMVARRWTSLHFTAETAIEFDPVHYMQMAGLICYYDTKDFVYLNVTFDEKSGKSLNLLRRVGGRALEQPLARQLPLGDLQKVYLKVEVDGGALQFFFSPDGRAWQKVGPPFETAHLSDEGVEGKLLRFTGAFVGLCAQDTLTASRTADFDYFSYEER